MFGWIQSYTRSLRHDGTFMYALTLMDVIGRAGAAQRAAEAVGREQGECGREPEPKRRAGTGLTRRVWLKRY